MNLQILFYIPCYEPCNKSNQNSPTFNWLQFMMKPLLVDIDDHKKNATREQNSLQSQYCTQSAKKPVNSSKSLNIRIRTDPKSNNENWTVYHRCCLFSQLMFDDWLTDAITKLLLLIFVLCSLVANLMHYGSGVFLSIYMRTTRHIGMHALAKR